ncbi:hypothetical protein G9A89_007794, partial [Geosiphon pyriformis]
MKKTIKVSGSEYGFKVVVLRKKRKEGVLAESIDNRRVAAEASGAHSWSSETGDTTESESIDMKKECLVKKTSVDYGENGAFTEEDPNQMPKDLHVKTKKVLGKPLGVIDYDTINTDDDVLDNSFLLLPSLSIKPTVQVSVCKSFTLNIDLMVIAEKFFQEKLSFIRKIFSSVNGFRGASTLSIFVRIICATFTLEKAMMAAEKLANNHGVVVNTDLKCPINNYTNRAIVMKEIPVKTSVEAVHAAMSEFGLIKSIKMQLVGLWQKAIDAVHVAKANVDKQTALLYTLSVRTNAHDLWDFVGSVGGKTCVIDRNPVSYIYARCATVCFGSESDLVSVMAATPVIKKIGLHWSYLSLALCLVCGLSGHTSLNCVLVKDQVRLANIYVRKSVPISCPLAFSVVGALLVHNFHGAGLIFGSNKVGKSLPPVASNLEKRLVNIESSLISLTGQIGELAKRLDSLMLAVPQPSPEWENMMGMGLGNATGNKTTAILDSTASPEVVKLENILEDLSALVISLLARLDGLALAGSKIAMCNVHGLNNSAKQDDVICWHKDMNNLVSIFTESKLKEKVHPWLANKFDGVWVFTSGRDSGFLGAGVLIVMNSSLAKHIYKVSKVPGRLLSIKLLFKNKLSVSILGLYAGASPVAGEINSLIAKAVNESSFVVLGGDFNKNGLHKCANFKKCDDLDLINSLRGSSFVKSFTWCNFCGITKTLDYMFISSNLVGAVVGHGMNSIEDYFDTDHKAVYVSVRLGGLLDVWLNSLCKQANRNCWKYDIKNASKIKWSEFRNATTANAVMFSDEFVTAKQFSDLDAMWDIVHKISSWFYKLELLVSKLVKASQLVSGRDFALLLDTWNRLDFLLKSKHAEESRIRQAIERRMESFEVDKDYTIRSVLECPFHKVILDHLVDEEELVLEPKLEAWVSMISKPYEWEGVLTNTHFIALIKTACKILSKILSDRISLACSKFDVLRGDNFSVLKGTTTQSLIFAVGSVIENALKKNYMCKAYDFVGWKHLRKSLVRIKMCDSFIKFFGSIHNGRTNKVITDFSLTDRYYVHDGLNQGEEAVCGYRLNSHFVSKTGWVESQAGLISFLATGAFVDDTIWVGNNHNFFRINDISINNEKTGEPHYYLGIFLSSEGLSRPSLVRAYLDVRFFTNLVLRKTISDKQFAYLVLAVLVPILFSHRSYDLQILSWCLRHPLLFPTRIRVNFLNNFLADVVCIFSDLDLSLGSLVASAFCLQSRTLLSLVLDCNGAVFSWSAFKQWKKLDLHGPVLFWYDTAVCFLIDITFPFIGLLFLDGSMPHNILQFCEFGVVSFGLLNANSNHLSVYTDGSLCWLETRDMKAGAAVFFKDINLGLDVSVSGLVSSTLAKLQAIALALECVSSLSSVDLFLDSQAALDVCVSESVLFHPDFRNRCWIECRHIANIIHHKWLDINWVKVKGHSSIMGNEHTDKFAKAAAFSDFCLPLSIDEWFLKAGGTIVFGNSRHFVHDVFQLVHCVGWEVDSGFRVILCNLRSDVDWFRSSLVWHPNSHLAAGFTSKHTADCRTYFMKALYHQFPVAVCKHLYDRCYPSMICLYCGDVEISDHVFSYPSDASAHARL